MSITITQQPIISSLFAMPRTAEEFLSNLSGIDALYGAGTITRERYQAEWDAQIDYANENGLR